MIIPVLPGERSAASECLLPKVRIDRVTKVDVNLLSTSYTSQIFQNTIMLMPKYS